MNSETITLTPVEIQANIHALELAIGIIGERDDEILELKNYQSHAQDDLTAMSAHIERLRESLLDSMNINWLHPDITSDVVTSACAVLEETPSQSLANIKADAFESGYSEGHNDTVESCYIDPTEAAEDYIAQLRKEGE